MSIYLISPIKTKIEFDNPRFEIAFRNMLFPEDSFDSWGNPNSVWSMIKEPQFKFYEAIYPELFSSITTIDIGLREVTTFFVKFIKFMKEFNQIIPLKCYSPVMSFIKAGIVPYVNNLFFRMKNETSPTMSLQKDRLFISDDYIIKVGQFFKEDENP